MLAFFKVANGNIGCFMMYRSAVWVSLLCFVFCTVILRQMGAYIGESYPGTPPAKHRAHGHVNNGVRGTSTSWSCVSTSIVWQTRVGRCFLVDGHGRLWERLKEDSWSSTVDYVVLWILMWVRSYSHFGCRASEKPSMPLAVLPHTYMLDWLSCICYNVARTRRRIW